MRVRRTAIRGGYWMAGTALVTVAGIACAVWAAGLAARNEQTHRRSDADRSSASVVSALQLAIDHQNDLVVNASGFMVAEPMATNAEFLAWTKAVQIFARYPELQAVGSVVLVDRSQLAAFNRQAIAEGNTGTFTPPAGDRRSYFCLSDLGQLRNSLAVPQSVDLCAGDLAGPLLAARDTGTGAYLPYNTGQENLLGVQTPVYRGGAVPATVAARRGAFLGWVGTEVNPTVLLSQALAGHTGLAVAMRYHQGATDVSFTSGTAAPTARAIAVDLHNGWTVSTFSPIPRVGVFSGGPPLAVLIVGIGLSVLLGLFVLLLGTARSRAVRMVDERTSELRHQALHDALTGLPNRALIMDRVEQLLVRNRRNGTCGAALFVDLDEFKNVNDTLGHEAGDRLLVMAAHRLQSTLRDADTIGRMGGDEFVVLIDGASMEVAPELVAERLLEVMRQPFELDGAAVPMLVPTSIGIAMGDRDSAGELLRDADVALYAAKAAGKNRYELFHPEMQTQISRRVDLEFDLRTAIACEQFRLVYQPIYNLDDLTIVGVEALLRWDHPTRGLVQPNEFIPVLEQTGQILEVGRWVLIQACTQMASWHGRGDTLTISVNVSGRQLDHDGIVDDIANALRISGLEPTSLIVEITETALMRNAEATARRLQAVKDLGVRIAVDDFGTGYSSLAYLRQFPVDCLKIDRMFTSAITTSPESRALIGTLVQLGKDLGLSTLAEGVETTEEMDLLRDQDVNQAQGFLLARPLDPAALEAQLLVPTRPRSAGAVSDGPVAARPD
ncbi:MAG: hypothetical protein JWO63_3396 [Frankiales bacterium]|nr:hypothetical protein [Frankiales bacterium]